MAYRAFVMHEFPLGAANDVLTKLTERNTQLQAKIRAKRAFKELKNDTQQIINNEIAKQKVIVEELKTP